jgi:Domain of unknown function (DUF3291)
MKSYHLAQLNIAKMKYSIEDPEMSDFVANLERINALAEKAPGFVWRLQSEAGDATAIDYFGPNILVNMSVWKDIDSLHDYVYRTAHAQIMSRRKEWFHRTLEAYTVLWWLPAAHIPTLPESEKRLKLLKEHGPTARAFTFRKAFPAPDSQRDNSIAGYDDLCPAI